MISEVFALSADASRMRFNKNTGEFALPAKIADLDRAGFSESAVEVNAWPLADGFGMKLEDFA